MWGLKPEQLSSDPLAGRATRRLALSNSKVRAMLNTKAFTEEVASVRGGTVSLITHRQTRGCEKCWSDERRGRLPGRAPTHPHSLVMV